MSSEQTDLFQSTNAHWIWPAAHTDPGAVNQYVEFLQDFEPSGGADDARLLISVDSNYAAWINGHFVGTGQFSDFPDKKSFDTLPVGAALRPGRNRLAILAYYCGENHQSYIKGRPGILYALKAGDTCAGSGTGTRWRAAPAYRQGAMARLTVQLPFTFEYDAARDDDWIAPGYQPGDDWQAVSANDATPLDHRPVHPRPLAKLPVGERAPAVVVAQGVFRRDPVPEATVAEQMGTDYLSPRTANAFFPALPGGDRVLTVTPVPLDRPLSFSQPEKDDDGTYLVIDLGRNECGYLDLELETAAPAIVDVAYGEHLDELRVRSSVGGRNFASRYRSRAGRQRFTYYVTRWAGRYLQLHISGCTGGTVLHYAGILPADYPVEETGRFDCADRLLKRIQEVGVRTLRICMHDHYEDTPWREQGLYANDARNQALCGFMCFGDYEFPKVAFDLLGQSVKDDGYLELCAPSETGITIPSFSLVWIIEVMETVLFSGDRAYASSLLPTVRKMIDAYRGTLIDGVLPSPPGDRYWHFYDWARGLHRAGENEFTSEALRNPRLDAPLNAFFARALDAAALLGDWTGDEGFAASCRETAAGVRAVFHDLFWHDGEELYVTYARSGRDPHLCELTQALALCGDLCPETNADALRARLVAPDNGLVETTLSQAIYKFEAALQDAYTHGAWVFERIAADWGSMLYRGATTFWETLKGGWDFFGAGSHSHGWSATPVYFFGSHLLGVRPLTPGFERFLVEPVRGVVPRASGRVPTPAGPIDVAWEERDGRIKATVRHPQALEMASPTADWLNLAPE